LSHPYGPFLITPRCGGEVQYLDYAAITPNDYETIRSNPQLYLHEELFPPPDDIMFFNVKNGPTSDVAVWKALAVATDRDYLLKTIWLGLGDVGTDHEYFLLNKWMSKAHCEAWLASETHKSLEEVAKQRVPGRHRTEHLDAEIVHQTFRRMVGGVLDGGHNAAPVGVAQEAEALVAARA
jgi:hypothetical protein